VVGIVGLMKTAQPMPIHFQQPGLPIVLLGGLGTCDATRFGGTQYAKVILRNLWGLPPLLDMAYEKRVQSAIRQIVTEGLAGSAHDVSDGGLAVALAEASFGSKGIGAHIELESDLRPEFALFHEGPSRVLLSALNLDRIRQIATENNVEAVVIGVTMKERLRFECNSATWIDAKVEELRAAWTTSLEHLLHQS
jgi:phosphoribosylformylglycinamidine synthase